MASIHSKRKEAAKDMAAGIKKAKNLSEGITKEQIEQNVATSTAIETGQTVEEVKESIGRGRGRRRKGKDNADS